MATKKTSKKQENGALEDALGRFFVGVGNGLRRLRSPMSWVGLALTVGLCAGAIVWRLAIWSYLASIHPVGRILIMALALLSPLLYLYLLGIAQRVDNVPDAVFEEIGFLNKNGTPPKLIYSRKEPCGKQSICVLGYASYIPLETWREHRAELETAIDADIRSITQGRSKRTVELRTLPGGLQIPSVVDWSDDYLPQKEGQIVVGVDQLQEVSFNLNKTPHVIVAGETGSGKSVILRTILWQTIVSGCRIYMIDFKGGVEFGKRFEQFGEVITERQEAVRVFGLLVEENRRRLELFREGEVKNLPEFNARYHHNLCRVVVFIDEIAEMLDKSGANGEDRELIAQLEGQLSTLARLSRATGINLIIGVQRPDAKILTGQIKNNIPVRICGRFADRAPSEIVMGNTMAMYLPDTKGRFLYRVGNEITEFQAFLFDDDRDLRDIEVHPGELLISSGSQGAESVSGEGEERATQRAESRTPTWKTAPEEPFPLGEPPLEAYDDYEGEDDEDEYDDEEDTSEERPQADDDFDF